MTMMMRLKSYRPRYYPRYSIMTGALVPVLIVLFLSIPICHGFTTIFHGSIAPPSLHRHGHSFTRRTQSSLVTTARVPSTPLHAVRHDDVQPHHETIRRSRFLATCGSTLASTLATLILTVPTHPALAAAALPTSKEALEQLKAAVQTTDALLKDWDTISSKGGDAIRAELGTNGGTSPLFQINKAVKVIQLDVAEDPVAFAEASEEYLLGLGRADSMAYSANFAGGAGKPTPPKVYIDKSKAEVELIKRYEKEMLEAIGK